MFTKVPFLTIFFQNKHSKEVVLHILWQYKCSQKSTILRQSRHLQNEKIVCSNVQNDFDPF